MNNSKLDKDHYNSSFRESLKKSMELPARPKGEWKSLNRRSYDKWDRLVILGIAFLVFAAVVGLWGLFVRLGR